VAFKPLPPGPSNDPWLISGDMMANYCSSAGFRGEALVTAIAVAKAESSWNAHAENWSANDAKWGPAVGLFQVRVLKHPGDFSASMDRRREYWSMRQPLPNAVFAYELSRGGKVWEPTWVSHSDGSYRKYLAQARQLAANASTGNDAQVAAGVPLVANDWIDEDRNPIPVNLGASAHAGEIGNSVVSATVDYSMAESSLSRFELEDEHATLLRTRRITEGVPLKVAGRRQVITVVGGKQGPATQHITVESQPAGVVRLRGVTPAIVTTTAVKFARNLAKVAGMHFAGGPASPKITITPADVQLAGTATSQALDPATGLAHGGRKENAWEVLQRLAKESKGYVCFEAGNVLYFATQKWLYEHAGTVWVQVGNAAFSEPRDGIALRAVGVPDISRTMKRDGLNRPYRHVEVSVNLPPGPGYNALPGMRLWMAEPTGLIGDARPMLITRTTISGGDRTALVRVQAASYSTPGDVESQPTTAHDDGTEIGHTHSALDFVTLCLRQNGDRYVFGAETKLSDPDPDAFDCSELVQWACAQVGVTIPDGSGAQAAHCTGIPVAQAGTTRGALLFHPGHVAVSLGDGKHTIEAMGTAYGVRKGTVAGRFTSGGLIPGMSYQ